MKNLLAILLVFMHAFTVSAQRDATEMIPAAYNYIPPSPNATSIGKFGDIPISLYTGTPSIDIPIYTIKTGDIVVPVSLSYHASGIKVEDKASNVGLGWALNAGGVISRTVRGLADEATLKGYLNNGIDMDAVINASLQDKVEYYYKVNDNEIDLQPDVFNYNFCGKSGKFLIDRTTRKGYLVNTNEVIDINWASNNEWVITDASGIKYYFGSYGGTTARDRSVVTQNGRLVGPSLNFSSAWYLLSIQDAKGNIVNLDYTFYNTSYCQFTQETTKWMYFAAPDPNAGCSNPSSKIAWDETEIFGSKITAITWNTGKINFNYSTIARTDLTTDDNRLQSIVVLDNATPANQKLKFNFIHSYFGRSSTPSNAICIPDGPTGRLRLDKIQQEGINGGLLAPYEFQYYGNILPSYMSYSQDHWGFNNGRSNTTLVPASKLIYNGNTVTLTGGNRSPDLEACESGTLSKITYPTGGSSQFIYELHSAYMQSFGFQPEPDVPYIKLAGVAKENFDRIPENDVIFEIDGDEVVGGISGITVRILTVVSGSCNPTIRDGGCGGEAYLIPVQGTQADTWLFSNVGSVNGSKLETKFLPNGHYKLVLGGYGSSSELKILAVVISVPDPNYIAPDGMINNPIGGLRIAKIINSDGFGLDNTKSYFYNREGEPSKSSGVLVSSPVYGYTVIKQQYHSSPLVGLFNTCYFYTRSANSKVSLGLTQGSHIGYSFVEEIKGSAENPKLGKTTYKYTSAGEYPDRQYSSFPFPPATSYDMKRGLLKEQKDYSFYGAGFQISREIINNYTLSDSRYRRFQKGVVVGSQGTSSDGTPSDVLFNEFSDESLWVWLQQTKTRLYASNQSGSYNETTLNYFYDNAVYPQLSRTETYNSKQELTKTELKYPYDLAASPGSTSNTYNEMVNRHILDKIVEQVKTNGTLNKELTKTKTHFSGFNSNLILPSVVENSFAGKNLQTEASFISYDSKGNVLQVNPRSTGPVSYVWGYDNTLPVAKVFNTAVTNIFYTSFEGAEGNSAEGDSRTGRKSITGGYVRFINNIANGNYILSYWKKNGSNWELQSSTISVTNGSATINIIGQIDELRFYPAKAQMMTYAYDPLTGIINECDVNNRINTYDYDEFGRLKLIKDQDNNIIKTFDYKYQQPIN